MRVKICGITKPDQGLAIAQLGATALGFICVPQSPRYVPPEQVRFIVEQLTQQATSTRLVDRIGVFANATVTEIAQTVLTAGLTGVQLHGEESVQFCHELRLALPQIEIIKAFRIRALDVLHQVERYTNAIDTLLLDAYHPGLLGGTGQTLEWQALNSFCPACPWFLAGGLTPENISSALTQIQPTGIDLSSGVERAPGDKDLAKVAGLFKSLKDLSFEQQNNGSKLKTSV